MHNACAFTNIQQCPDPPPKYRMPFGTMAGVKCLPRFGEQFSCWVIGLLQRCVEETSPYLIAGQSWNFLLYSSSGTAAYFREAHGIFVLLCDKDRGDGGGQK